MGGRGAGQMPIPTGGPKILDVHAHFLGQSLRDAVAPAIEFMDKLSIAKTLIMPPPQPPGHRNIYDYDSFVPLIRPHGARFGFLGGGGTLNPMIHAAKGSSTISDATRRDFEAKAEQILAAGAAGFGEITAHHVSYFAQHPYEAIPADHPMLRLLADIAARRDVPIDLHMDPVPRDMPSPARLAERGGQNPRTLAANIDGFERLLAHNRRTKIVWAHAGRDTLGTWTVALSRNVLRQHANLYMSLSLHPPFGVVPENSLLGEGGQPNPAWIGLIEEFPDRFVIGSDYFHQAPGRDGQTLPAPTPAIRRFVNALPPALGLRVAHENAIQLYRVALA
jgi:predicted TIM-barrel fold metal-dependent hydrolase